MWSKGACSQALGSKWQSCNLISKGLPDPNLLGFPGGPPNSFPQDNTHPSALAPPPFGSPQLRSSPGQERSFCPTPCL